MPGWLLWYTYLNPVYYSLYGLISSQLGDVAEDQLENAFTGYFGDHHSFIGWCVLIQVAFNLAFRAVIAFSIKYLNWQKR